MRGSRTLIVGAGLALAMLTEVAAQTPASLPVTPAKLALAQSVVTASGAQRNSSTLLKTVFNQMSTSMGDATSPADKAFMADLLRQETMALVDKVIQSSAEIYAETFTDEELAGLLAFYQSPTGQSLISKQGVVAQRTLAIVMPLIPSMQRDILDKTFAHLCEQQKCTPEMRAKLVAARDEFLRRQVLPPAH